MTTLHERGVEGRGRTAPEAGAPASAIGLIFGSGFLFSCLDTSGKFLVTAGFEAPFVAWVRFAVHLALVLILFRAWRNSALFRVSSLPWQIVRGGFLFGSTLCNFLALRTLQLAETVSIFYFAPMVITALAGPLLGEWAGWRRWMAIIAGFAGVLVIMRPGLGAFSVGHVFALGAMTCYSFYVILTRRLGTRETAESLIFYSALTPVVLILPAVPFYGVLPSDPLHWAVLVALGFFGGFGHWLLILAYRQATTYVLAPYPYLQMVWMVTFGYIVFGDLPDAWTILGAAIIVASGLYVVRREYKLRLAGRGAVEAEDAPPAKRL